MCKNNQEDVTHALYLCLKLIDFRQPIPLWNHSNLRQSSNFADTMGCIFAENRVSTLFSMVIWAIWNRWNNQLGKQYGSLLQILEQAEERLVEFSVGCKFLIIWLGGEFIVLVL